MGVFSGAVLLAKDGEVLLKMGYGMANYELDVPNTPKTKFRIASVSKPFTAMAIAQLWEAGTISAQTTLQRFLPDYQEADKISIDHLLHSRSGVPHINELPWYEEQTKLHHTLPEVIELFKDEPLDFEPGMGTSTATAQPCCLPTSSNRCQGRPTATTSKSVSFDRWV